MSFFFQKKAFFTLKNPMELRRTAGGRVLWSRNNIAREIDEFKLRIVKARTIFMVCQTNMTIRMKLIDVLSRPLGDHISQGQDCDF